MNDGTRPSCYAIPSERIAAFYWAKAQEPTAWRALWDKIAKAWRTR